EHEATREASVEFRRPSATAWRHAQAWAQRETDRAGGSLEVYEPIYDPVTPEARVSYVIGVALGRFCGDGNGVLDQAPPSAVSSGVLFVSIEGSDSVDTKPCRSICECWNQACGALAGGDDLRTFLRKSFFDYHKKAYDKRPIYFPLSSAKKSFVAF